MSHPFRLVVRALSLAVLAVLLSVPGVALARPRAVLPPSATPYGYSLRQMAKLVAPFSSKSNDQAYYPKTPFTILHVDYDEGSTVPEGSGYATVESKAFPATTRTTFYVPLWNATDSPPVAGVYPRTNAQAKRYFFDPSQLDARHFEIIVDGKRVPIGPEYIAGPVRATVLDDDGDATTPLGSHIITLGAFLGPLPCGEHTVRVRGGLYGPLISAVYPGVTYLREDLTYTITVR